MEVKKFDFTKNWHLVEPYLDNPEVLDSLDEGMFRFSQQHGWRHLPLWDRKNGIGPWRYEKNGSHGDYALERANEAPERYRLVEKCTKIVEKMGVNLDEHNMDVLEFLDWQEDNPKFEKILDSYDDEVSKIADKYYPKENTYKWYQCFGACFFLAEWHKTLARKVYPKYDWQTCQKWEEEKSIWDFNHSTTIGKSLKGDIIIFDILLFESTSTEEILEAARVELNELL